MAGFPNDQSNPAGAIPVYTAGAANISTATVNVVSTAGGTLIAAARPGRRSVTVTNGGAIAVYLGAAGVTTSSGTFLIGTAGAQVTLAYSGDLYGIAASGTELVSVAELY